MYVKLILKWCLFSVCFKIFDQDSDGFLKKSEIVQMFETMLEVSEQSGSSQKTNSESSESSQKTQVVDNLVKELLQKAKADKEGKENDDSLSLEEFLVWTVGNSLPEEFSKLIFQVSLASYFFALLVF